MRSGACCGSGPSTGNWINLAHVRQIRVDTWAGDDYGVAATPLHSVVAVIDNKSWATLASGFTSKAEAQTWLDTKVAPLLLAVTPEWASAEIDPAESHWLRNPVGELLTWAGTVVKEERDANQDA